MSDEQPQNLSEGLPAAPQTGALDLAQSLEIERTGGRAKVVVHHFPALTGWEIRRQYREYLESKDPTFRINFTVTVLSHASIVVATEDGESEAVLSNHNVVNQELEHWQNVEKVFEAVLGYNGIKVDVAEVERRRWQIAGEDMAASFLASVQTLISPALIVAASGKADS